METALLAMMGSLLVMMAGLFLKLVDLGTRMGRVETKVDTALLFMREHTHDRETGQAVAPIPVETN